MDAHAKTEPVEQRHGSKHLVARPEHGVGRDDLLAQRVKVFIGQFNAFGSAGGAAGIQDHGGVVGFSLHPVSAVAEPGDLHEIVPADHGSILRDLLDLASFGEHVAGTDGTGKFILDGGDDDIDHLRVFADVLEFVIELIQRHGRHGFGFIQIELDLLFRGKRMDHVGDAAHHVDGIEHVNGLGTVGHGDGDPVTGTDADGL